MSNNNNNNKKRSNDSNINNESKSKRKKIFNHNNNNNNTFPYLSNTNTFIISNDTPVYNNDNTFPSNPGHDFELQLSDTPLDIDITNETEFSDFLFDIELINDTDSSTPLINNLTNYPTITQDTKNTTTTSSKLTPLISIGDDTDIPLTAKHEIDKNMGWKTHQSPQIETPPL